jgi:hypothetical protein
VEDAPALFANAEGLESTSALHYLSRCPLSHAAAVRPIMDWIDEPPATATGRLTSALVGDER